MLKQCECGEKCCKMWLLLKGQNCGIDVLWMDICCNDVKCTDGCVLQSAAKKEEISNFGRFTWWYESGQQGFLRWDIE